MKVSCCCPGRSLSCEKNSSFPLLKILAVITAIGALCAVLAGHHLIPTRFHTLCKGLGYAMLPLSLLVLLGYHIPCKPHFEWPPLKLPANTPPEVKSQASALDSRCKGIYGQGVALKKNVEETMQELPTLSSEDQQRRFLSLLGSFANWNSQGMGRPAEETVGKLYDTLYPKLLQLHGELVMSHATLMQRVYPTEAEANEMLPSLVRENDQQVIEKWRTLIAP